MFQFDSFQRPCTSSSGRSPTGRASSAPAMDLGDLAARVGATRALLVLRWICGSEVSGVCTPLLAWGCCDGALWLSAVQPVVLKLWRHRRPFPPIAPPPSNSWLLPMPGLC
jgi:hypothetical protein